MYMYTAMPDKRSSDSDWRLLLSPFEYKVLREKGTEPRGGEYDQFFPEPTEGVFYLPRVCTASIQRCRQI